MPAASAIVFTVVDANRASHITVTLKVASRERMPAASAPSDSTLIAMSSEGDKKDPSWRRVYRLHRIITKVERRNQQGRRWNSHRCGEMRW